MTYLLGIDLGTSSVKVAVVDADTLQAVSIGAAEYPVYHPQAGYAEQNPDDWWQATIRAVHVAIEKIDESQIEAISCSGQMHGFVCLDSDLQPVHPAIIWADTRSTAEIAALRNLQDSLDATLSGLPATGYAASTFLWLHHHQAETLAQTHVWCLPKDYLRLQMTGEVHTDPSDAAATWLFDVKANDWVAEVVSFCGLSAEQMPPIVPSDSVCGTLTDNAAKSLGLKTGIPIIAGSADLPAQALGQGIIHPDTMLLIVGTGGQIFIPSKTAASDPQNRYYLLNHNLPESWYIQSAILSGGLSLRWLRDLLGLSEEADAYPHLSTLASRVPAGANGLLFLPYLAGERSPLMDSQASGLLLGLRLHHGQAHFARAIMEGVAFALKDCLVSIKQVPQQIILSGGITQSAIWSQILADILEKPLHVLSSDSPHGAVGTAILAGIGIGLFDATTAIARLPKADTIITPQPQAIYVERFAQYQRLYPLLKDEMHQLTDSSKT